MKKIYKLFLVSVLITGTLFQSCETTELELTDNPNALVEGDPTFLLNSIQTTYRAAQVVFNDRSSELTRIDYMFGRNYFANYNSATLNAPWGALYSTILPNIQAIEAAQTEDNDLRLHLAIAKTLQAHLMMQLADFIGDIVPLEQATQPILFPTPELTNDAGVTAYNSALAVLNEAIAIFQEDPSNIGVQDLFYGDQTGAGTDPNSWIKLANTLKMRAALTTGDLTTFNNLVAGGDFISSSEDDFQFNFGTQLTPVNTQHQDYQLDYTTSGAAIYQSNWLMQLMLTNEDPRRRYYFYRQTDCTPGASCEPDGNGETLTCSLEETPTHLQGTPSGDIWCSVEEGYWGRLHCDDDGTPPDNFLRTAVGVYPAGGNFDGDRFRTGEIVFDEGDEDDPSDDEWVFDANNAGVTLGQGANGAGFEPIILASYVDFWRAEAALVAGNTTMASMHIENGLSKSMTKVTTSVLDSSFDGGALLDNTTFDPVTGNVINSVTASSLVPSPQDLTDFVADIVAQFDNAGSDDDRWNLLAEQYFTTMYGGGADAFNFYRRTGFPTTVGLCQDVNPGDFIRTFLYPQNEVIANPNIVQRTDNSDAVFWNTQALPSAN